MQLFDAPWINHEGGGIFSIDIHPLGKKLATAGQDQHGSGLLVIWPIEFLFQPRSNLLDSDGYGFLARIPHSKSINCVRWAPKQEGDCVRLVCGGDDPILCIYECRGSFTSLGTLGSKCGAKNLDDYRCVQKLVGHTLDVMHVDWSPDGKYLASCSLDNTIIIWNAKKLPEKVAVLKFSNGGHDRGVKGLAWDPLTRFLSTQAEDNSLKVWRTDSWECVQTFLEPFEESTGTTLFSRMDWSPNGGYLICPCAMNNGGPTAKVICRKDWSFERDLVGFRKAVTCVRANRRCFFKVNSSGKRITASCFATGSRDRSLAVWMVPSFGRPLLVLSKVFKLSILDLAWNHLTLAACSRDGAVKLFQFSELELGDALSSHDMAVLSERLYGFRPQVFDNRKEVVADEDLVYVNWLKSLQHANKIRVDQQTIVNVKRKFSTRQLERMVLKVKRQKMEVGSTTGAEKSAKGEVQATAGDEKSRKRKAGWRPRHDSKLFGRESDSSGASSSSPTESFRGFTLPEQKRLLFTRVRKWKKNASSIGTVEVLNEFEMLRTAETNFEEEKKCTRICAYCKNDNQKAIWTLYTPKIASLLASNSCWTVLATFDGGLTCLSTTTGRMIFNVVLSEPACILQLLGDVCLIIDRSGGLTCWNLQQNKCQTKNSIRELFNSEDKAFESLVQQLVTPLLQSYGQNLQPRIMLSDYTSLIVTNNQENSWIANGDGLSTLLREFFGKFNCFIPSILFPPSMVVPKSISPDMNSLRRIFIKNTNESIKLQENPSAMNEEEEEGEGELQKLLLAVIKTQSSAQIRFLASLYAFRLASKGKVRQLPKALDCLLDQTREREATEVPTILQEVFQEFEC